MNDTAILLRWNDWLAWQLQTGGWCDCVYSIVHVVSINIELTLVYTAKATQMDLDCVNIILLDVKHVHVCEIHVLHLHTLDCCDLKIHVHVHVHVNTLVSKRVF